MADDNILAGLGGFLGGIRDVYVPYALKDIEERRKRIPISRVEALSGVKTGLDPNELVTPDELGLVTKRRDYLNQLEKEKRVESRQLEREERSDVRFGKRFEDQTERMVDLQDIKEQNRIEQEERKKTGDRYTVPPKIESQYADLINQTKLANNIESGLNLAIKKRINVTGLFSSPYNKFREIIGTLPKEEQDILTTLRLGFADFVRERGGTAFTPTEKEVFGPIMPEEDKDEKTNINRIRKMIDILQDKKDNFESSYLGLTETYSPVEGIKKRVRKSNPLPLLNEKNSSALEEIPEEILNQLPKDIKIKSFKRIR
ncbi:MAG: hypothetical protein A2W75_04015 [Nitrospinae bacterium RIFCSPLOWO2_12_39_15]|nr:MAG: hypothetical protein A2W75_04015 [Nitrospinae bacterium RIFCSPLOWO2_12_39_15]